MITAPAIKSKLFPPDPKPYDGWRFIPSFSDGSWISLRLGKPVREEITEPQGTDGPRGGWVIFEFVSRSGSYRYETVYKRYTTAENEWRALDDKKSYYIQPGTLLGLPDQGSPAYPAFMIFRSYVDRKD